MRYVRGVSITLALLGGVWGAMFAIAAVAGVIPSIGPSERVIDERERSAPVERPEAPVDAGASAEAGERAIDRPESSRDLSREPPPERPPAAGRAAPPPPLRYPLGPKSQLGDASVLVTRVAGHDGPALVVGAADRFEVLGLRPDRTLVRLGRVRVALRDETWIPNARGAAAADITGDGIVDLLLPFFVTTTGGGSRGGAAYLLPGRAGGGFARPVQIAGGPVVAVAILDLDSRGGADPVVVLRGNYFGEIPGTLLSYRGGPRPAITARLTLGFAPDAIAAGHFDDDDRLDILWCGMDIGVAHDVGRGRFELREAFNAANDDCSAASADIDGDGRTDVVVSQPATRVIRGSPPAESSIAVTEWLLAAADLDGDARTDLIGFTASYSATSQSLVTAQLQRGAAWAPRPIAELGEAWVYDAAASDLDGDGAIDLAIVAGGTTLDLLVVPAVMARDRPVRVSSPGTIEPAEPVDEAVLSL